jgi:ABC-2 type transport system ATP-binding protein
MINHGRFITGTLGQQARPKVIELHQLTVLQNEQPLLHKTTLTLFEGETAVLIGDSEQAKNALLACLLGQIQPAEGSIRVLGATLPPLPVALRRQIGVMPRQIESKTQETVSAYLQRFSAYHGVQLTRTQLARYCAHYQLSPDAPLQALDQLQMRVLALATALVHDPRLALLFEPLSELEEKERALLQGYLQQIQREGRTLFCTGTPPLDEKMFTGYDLMVRLEKGQLSRVE